MAFDPAAWRRSPRHGSVGRELVRAGAPAPRRRPRGGVGPAGGAWGLDADITQAVALHHGGPTLFACPTPLVACVQLGDTIARMATGHITSDPQTDLALRKLGAWPALIDDLLDELTEPQPAATELSSHLHELQREASTDDLTGVANRRAWRATLRTYLEEGRPGSVLVCDLDEFKQLNDTPRSPDRRCGARARGAAAGPARSRGAATAATSSGLFVQRGRRTRCRWRPASSTPCRW